MDVKRHKKRTPVKLAKPTRVVAVVDDRDVEPSSFQYCRMLMGEKYIHSRRGYAVRELCALPEFAHLGVTTAESWCHHDHWVERRRDLQEEVRNNVTRALIAEMTQERIDHLRKLTSLRTAFDNVGMLTNAEGNVEFKLQPKSLEAWVTAKVKLDQHIGKIQTTVAGELPQITAEALVATDRSEHLPLSLKPRLTEDESLDLALRLRDKRMREDEEAAARWKASQKGVPADDAGPKKKKPPPRMGNQ